MSWLADASANKIVKSYIQDFVDISGNFKVRNTVSGTSIDTMDVSGGIVSFIGTSVENYTTTNTYSYSTSQLGSDIVGTESGESRGKVVDMNEDGTVLIAGSFGLNNTSGTAGGAAFIYNYQSGSWVQKGSTIKPYYSTNSAAQFGQSVAINNTGDIVVVGSYNGSGTMEVYEYINSAWSVKGSIINGNSSGHNFGGQGVAINGEGNIVAGYSMTGGYVKVYQYSDDTNDWVQIGSSISETTSTHYLTASHRPISLNNAGTRLAIGNHDHNSGAGRVIIYDYSSDSWSQVGSTIEGSNFNGSGSEFGQNVSLSSDGTILAVGAPDGGSDGQLRGTVNIFKYDSVGNTWDQMGDTLEELDSQTHSYGQDLKISGDGTLLITSDGVAPNLSSDSSYRKGTVFIYKYSDGSWARIVKIVNSDNIDKWWGESCAMSRDGTKFVGASRAMDVGATNTGLSRMYELIATVTSSTTVFDSYSYGQTMKIEDGTVDISGTTWINQGQSGASIATSNQGAFIVESAGTSSSNSVVYVETAGQTQAFSIRENGDLYSANALQHSSDDRRKTNEQYITNATETIQKLSPQIYTKLNDLVQNGGTGTKTESGLIAQEIYYNAPELRHLIHIEDEYGNKLTPQEYDLSGNDIQNDPDYTSLGWGNKSATVDYTGLIPYLIKSNQEKQTRLEQQDATIDEQLVKIEDLKTRVTALEA